MSTDCPTGYAFILGGRDLEMATISDILHALVPSPRVLDKRLPWGAKASDYRSELAGAVAEGLVPVLVELEVDLELPPNAIIVDHHGDRAGADRPTSLEQIFALLDLPREDWKRRFDLVAANDRGHVAALTRIGATVDEMLAIRRDDRAAQGVTAEEESLAAGALRQAETLCEGALTFVRLPHERTSPLADGMERDLGGPGYENLLIGTPGGSTFYGSGRLVEILRTSFPDGWSGGDLPARGFWGGHVPCERVKEVLVAAIHDE